MFAVMVMLDWLVAQAIILDVLKSALMRYGAQYAMISGTRQMLE